MLFGGEGGTKARPVGGGSVEISSPSGKRNLLARILRNGPGDIYKGSVQPVHGNLAEKQ